MKAPSHTLRERLSAWQTSAVQTGRKDDKHAAAHNERAKPLQDELIAAVKDGPLALANLMRGKLGLGVRQGIAAPELPRPLTSFEFRDPPLALERDLCGALPDLTPAIAAQPAFWTVCHIVWIEADCFEISAGTLLPWCKGVRQDAVNHRSRCPQPVPAHGRAATRERQAFRSSRTARSRARGGAAVSPASRLQSPNGSAILSPWRTLTGSSTPVAMPGPGY